MLVRHQFSKCRKSQLKWENMRNFATVKVKDRMKGEDDDGLNELMHGRKNMERRDSVNDIILLERQAHQLRIKDIEVDKEVIKLLTALGVGSKKRNHAVYKIQYNQFIDIDEGTYKKSMTGSGGFAVHVASASSNWPILRHLLPEIAFAGHSNCGKSTLVNSMVGLLPKKGPAKISNRAGWTDQICFYQLGKKPPVFTVSDLPGYGHAVASDDEKRAWKIMIRDYLGNRQVLSRCCVLVDCTRGLCDADINILAFLNKVQVPWIIVLTKCDLLSVLEVGQSIAAVDADLAIKFPNLVVESEEETQKMTKKALETNFGKLKRIIPVSSATGAGIQKLWRDLLICAKNTTINPEEENSSVVREHRNADVTRRSDVLKQLNDIKKSRIAAAEKVKAMNIKNGYQN